MELSRIIISETNDEQVIVLKEVEGARAFPIVIGIWEAVAIDRNIKGKKTPRPMTHDLIENVISGLDARLERVITRMNGATPEELVDSIRADVLEFVAGAEPADDMSVLALRWMGPVGLG